MLHPAVPERRATVERDVKPDIMVRGFGLKAIAVSGGFPVLDDALEALQVGTIADLGERLVRGVGGDHAGGAWRAIGVGSVGHERSPTKHTGERRAAIVLLS